MGSEQSCWLLSLEMCFDTQKWYNGPNRCIYFREYSPGRLEAPICFSYGSWCNIRRTRESQICRGHSAKSCITFKDAWRSRSKSKRSNRLGFQLNLCYTCRVYGLKSRDDAHFRWVSCQVIARLAYNFNPMLCCDWISRRISCSSR